MKNILIIIVFITQTNFAQSIFPVDGGNVGIGTTSPTQKLDVRGNGLFNGIILSSISDVIGGQIQLKNLSKVSTGEASTWTIYNMTGGYGNSLQFWAYDDLGCGGGLCANRFTIMDNGNVGIGAATPYAQLTLNKVSGILGDPQNLILYNDSSNSVRYGFGVNGAAGGMDFCANQAAARTAFRWYGGADASTPNQLMALLGNGNLGIGTRDPQNKLDVNGTIHSKEVKVDMTGWSDFVFKKEYNLPTLEQVEKHIAEKGHLENIPSEEEVLKNGINLGEMDAKLLQKIEELTLYMIEMKKENQVLKNAVEKQNKEIELLKLKRQ
ncbi:TMF family protein [Flavobacterium sp. LPB0248]|uniref:TMF family protein n=1 Tax=Flavobacterium sp. LPB0248 TaxID=2614441 RepID=UPI0015A57E55|nr:TMF family protein [Flavobacterium sp. LPB0248]QLC64960.1 TMF family protein [Flavobacterium sp. LPB0248]